MNWQHHLQARLTLQKQKQAYRQRIVRSQDRHSCFMYFSNKRLLNFGSNDYLGLSQDKQVIHAWQQALSKYGTGSGGSTLVTGHTDAHHQLEKDLAAWQGYECALLFPSGFTANQAVILGLMAKNDVFIADKLCHASMQEAAMLSATVFKRFAHQNYPTLEQQLIKHAKQRILVASEGVFSMDGDCADIAYLNRLTNQYGAWLFIDDAHGIGVIGDEGKGSIANANIRPEILMLAFGKAVGIMGAAILCSQTVAEYLTQFARHLIYSTAMPPAQAVAIQASLKRIRQADDLRSKLNNNIHTLHSQLRKYGLHTHLLPSNSAIQALICGSNEAVLTASQQLFDLGLYVPAIRPPTVPQGQARLRITITATHRESDIIQLAQGLDYVFNK